MNEILKRQKAEHLLETLWRFVATSAETETRNHSLISLGTVSNNMLTEESLKITGVTKRA